MAKRSYQEIVGLANEDPVLLSDKELKRIQKREFNGYCDEEPPFLDNVREVMHERGLEVW